MIQNQLHVQRAVGTKGRNGLLRIEYLHLRVRLDVAGGDYALAGGFNVHGLGAGRMQKRYDALDIEDDLGHVLLHTGDSGKLMLYACDLDAGAGGTGER